MDPWSSVGALGGVAVGTPWLLVLGFLAGLLLVHHGTSAGVLGGLLLVSWLLVLGFLAGLLLVHQVLGFLVGCCWCHGC